MQKVNNITTDYKKRTLEDATRVGNYFTIVYNFCVCNKKVLNVIVPHCGAVGYGFLFYCVPKTVMNCLLLYITLVLTANTSLNVYPNKQSCLAFTSLMNKKIIKHTCHNYKVLFYYSLKSICISLVDDCLFQLNFIESSTRHHWN